MKPEAVIFALFTLALAACATGAVDAEEQQAAEAASTGPAPVMAMTSRGYLAAGTLPDAAATIAPSPKEGDLRNTADWAIFKSTRALEGTDRWTLAQFDDSYQPKDILKGFSCAAGVELTPDNSPTLAVMIARVSRDAGGAAEGAKQLYKRTRPYLHNEGNICIEKSEGLARSYDYPSGHASLGWANGLIMAELAPDRATQVLQRARAFGESRVVCGMHNYSAVEAARTNAAGVVAALHGNAEFQADLGKAKAEMAAARASAAKPDAAACVKEFELTRPLQVF
jgi:acid phosphatase (class A)